MQEYQVIIEKFGEPFPTEGRRNPRVNPIFFAAAFLQDFQVKYFPDVGWLKMENGRWHNTSSAAIKIAIRDLILRLMRSTSKSCFSQITPGLLHEIMQMVQLENGAERFPPLDPDIIPVTNGILYWEPVSQELKFRDYNQEDIILDSLTVSYIPNAPAPLFEEKIREIIPDADDRRVVQDYLGASLFPANRTRKFLLFQGEGGCGKSLLVLLLSRLLGPTRVFDLNFKHISSTFGFSDLTTQTLLTASEAISGGLCSSGGELVKKITGGDYFQTAGHLREDGQSFVLGENKVCEKPFAHRSDGGFDGGRFSDLSTGSIRCFFRNTRLFWRRRRRFLRWRRRRRRSFSDGRLSGPSIPGYRRRGGYPEISL